MTPLIPPKGSGSVCGQVVLAMILDVPLAEACRIVGHRHGTKARELRAALRSRGVGCADKPELTRYEEISARAILRLSRPTGKNWHWMLAWDGQIYDPAGHWPNWPKPGWEITSFIEVSA